jgi:hypothetical protein
MSQHFLDKLAKKKSVLGLGDRSVETPTLLEWDPQDPILRLALRAIPPLDGRVLRVVYNWTTDPWTLVTAHLDRSRRSSLLNIKFFCKL